MTPGEDGEVRSVAHRKLYSVENAIGCQERRSDGNPLCDADMLTPRIVICVFKTDTRQAASAIFC